MKILVSNDDGYRARGIHVLTNGLRKSGHDVVVVAPARDRSTVGHSLTLHKPLRMVEVAENEYWVSGSPADCIYMATRHLLKSEKPDLVVSGVNNGANLGHDIFYSGTVAAAREALLFGIPSVAVSLARGMPDENSTGNWDTVTQFVEGGLNKMIMDGFFEQSHLTNINIPDVTSSELKGIKVASQGRRNYADVVQEHRDPRNKKYYWVGGAYQGYDPIENSDCVFVNEKYISVTPLKIDTTDYESLNEMRKVENVSWD